ncbi:MAG: 20-beta-hydroxysteroid dehydrogenase [Bryobacteraceae bacterium]|nr:MAG: 20-beta-hydroxysteroid dehydrogenase [Bryobacteraceae bacterium]
MGNTALVTGANRGIGLAVARRLAELGHFVFLGSRDWQAGHEAAAALRRLGLQARPLRLDLADAASIDAAVAEAATSGHTIEILINNAGVLHEKPLLELTDAEIAESIAVHLTGPLRLVQRLAPAMAARGYGRIVNVSSGWGSFAEGMGGPGLYGVTKAALNALTVRLAHELPGTIKVNAMCPGWVRTRMGGDAAPRTPEEGADTAVWLATLPPDGPTGGFFRDRQLIPW